MSLVRLFFVLAILCWYSSGVKAEKPKLEGFLVAARVDCPIEVDRICLLINRGDTWYVVQGEGFGKEDTIWLIDKNKIRKATDITPHTEYLKLIWARGKDSV
jgi:hypothetical protein